MEIEEELNLGTIKIKKVMLTESRKQDLKNLVYDLNAWFTETDVEEVNHIESDLCFNLKHILEWIDKW